MLHIVRRADLVASWGEQGWPTLLGKVGDRPEPDWLYWSLTELGPAADQRDLRIVDDLLAEIAQLLERLWSVDRAGISFAPISASLWGEIQRGRGAEDMTSLALHGRLLRNTLGPARTGPRPADVAPPYRAAADRVAGGHLALVDHASEVDFDHDPAAVFLQLLATVLSNHGGHLVDAAGGGAPAGVDAGRISWRSGPEGQVLGSVNRDTVSDVGSTMLLRPGPSVDAVNAVAVATGSERVFAVESVGRALAEAWLIDTTLRVDLQLRREFNVMAQLTEDLDEEPLWRLPLAVFHPRQFPLPTWDRAPRAPRLRIIRTSEDH